MNKDYGAAVRIWDNGGKSADRYTILPPRWAGEGYKSGQYWNGIACDHMPFHPRGFGQHCTAMQGSHLGKRIHWNDLPVQAQDFARQLWPEFTPKKESRYD